MQYWKIDVRVKKVRNGYRVTIYDGFWLMIGHRFIANNEMEVANIIEAFLHTKLALEGGVTR